MSGSWPGEAVSGKPPAASGQSAEERPRLSAWAGLPRPESVSSSATVGRGGRPRHRAEEPGAPRIACVRSPNATGPSAWGRLSARRISFLSGWVTYFRYARAHGQPRVLDAPAFAGVRCVRLKRCKQPAALRRFLRQARELASSGRGWWCLGNSLQAKIAIPTAWFDQLGLINLTAAMPCSMPRETAVVHGPYARWCESGEP